RLFRGQLPCHQDRPIGAFGGIGQNQLRAQDAQDGNPLSTGTIRDSQGDGNPQGRAEGGVGDPHIAGGRIQQTLTVPEITVCQGSTDNVQGRPVFDGTARVEPLRFGKDSYTRGQIPPNSAQR